MKNQKFDEPWRQNNNLLQGKPPIEEMLIYFQDPFEIYWEDVHAYHRSKVIIDLNFVIIRDMEDDSHDDIVFLHDSVLENIYDCYVYLKKLEEE